MQFSEKELSKQKILFLKNVLISLFGVPFFIVRSVKKMADFTKGGSSDPTGTTLDPPLSYDMKSLAFPDDVNSTI